MATLLDIYKFEEQLESGFADLINTQVLSAASVHTADFSVSNPPAWDVVENGGFVTFAESAFGEENLAKIEFDSATFDTYMVYEGLTIGESYYLNLSCYSNSNSGLAILTGSDNVGSFSIQNSVWISKTLTFVATATSLKIGIEAGTGFANFIWIQSGLKISTVDPVANTYYRRSTSTKASPFIDVLVTVGEALEHERYRSSKTTEDMFKGTLSLDVNTNRAFNPATHHTLLSNCRIALLPTEADFSTDTFPNLAVLDIRATDTSYAVDDDTGLDTTTLTFDFTFGIRPSAWPA